MGRAWRVVIPYQFRSVSIRGTITESAGAQSRRNPLSIQVCFNMVASMMVEGALFWVVIPYQFRSVSMSWQGWLGQRRNGRNPLSIQVCFNPSSPWISWWLNWVVIPYQFRSVSIQLQQNSNVRRSMGRNPLSIQVCFNAWRRQERRKAVTS